MTNPVAVDFLKSLTYKFGLDPKQQIDMNDPMTRLVMAISIATTEQGENIYSYDQYIKGCAESAGIDPAVFDSEVNPTSLGIENNNPSTGTNASSAGGSAGGSSGNTSGYVSPKLPKIVAGGSSLPTTLISQYAATGTAAILATPAFQNVFGGISLNTISFKDGGLVVDTAANAVGNGVAASVTNAQGVITAASAGVPTAFGENVKIPAGTSSQADATLKAQLESQLAADRIDVGLPPTLSDSEWAAAKGIVVSEGGNPAYTLAALANRSIASGEPLDVVAFADKQFTPATSALTGYGDRLVGVDTAGFQKFNTGALSPATGSMEYAVTNLKEPYDKDIVYFNTASLGNINGTNPVVLNGQVYASGSLDADYSKGGAANVAKWDAFLTSKGSTIPTIGTSGDIVQVGSNISGADYQALYKALPYEGAKFTVTDASFVSSDGTGTYREITSNGGLVYYQNIKTGAIYDSADNIVKPPNGVPANFTNETLNDNGTYTYSDPAKPEATYTMSADFKSITNNQTSSGLYSINSDGILVPAGATTATTGGPVVISADAAINNANIDSVTAGVNIRSGAGYGDMYTGTGTFGIGGASMMSENSSGIVVPANTGAPAAWSGGALTAQENIANQVNDQSALYAANSARIDQLTATNATLQAQINQSPDLASTPGVTWNSDLAANNATIANLQRDNSNLQGLIANSTEQYDSMTPYNPPDTMPDNAYSTFNTPASMYNTPLSPATGFSTDTAAVPTPDTGVVNSSNITPGSQAQTNAANAAAGGMGAPGC